MLFPTEVLKSGDFLSLYFQDTISILAPAKIELLFFRERPAGKAVAVGNN